MNKEIGICWFPGSNMGLQWWKSLPFRAGKMLIQSVGTSSLSMILLKRRPLDDEVVSAFCTQFLENIMEVYFHGSLA